MPGIPTFIIEPEKSPVFYSSYFFDDKINSMLIHKKY